MTVEGEDGTVSERVRLRRDEVSADFFRAMGTPLLQGRFFSLADRANAPLVAIVNEAMARRLWPGQDPVGRRLKLGPSDASGPRYTVAGIVGDMRPAGLEREPVPQMFESLAQQPPRSVDVFIRTASDDQHSIATRTREIGSRMAVGARANEIFRLVLGEGLMLALAGLAVGLVGAWWLGRAGSSLLFGVTAGDPWTFATVSLLLLGVAAAACYFPARRATRLDPVVALRMT